MPKPFFPSLPPSPPYGVTTPRTLVRWNDINAQNGPLTRTRGFIQLPANFYNNSHSNPTSKSRKMIQFNYQITDPQGRARAFSLMDLSPLTPFANVGVTFTVAWGIGQIGQETLVVRYLLAGYPFLTFATNGAVTTFPQYTNQAIPSTFCIEVWDPGNGVFDFVSGNDSPVVLFTSILGTSDYRYTNDFNVGTITCIAQDNDFNETSGLTGGDFNLPFTFNQCPTVPIGIVVTNSLFNALSDESHEILTDEISRILLPN